MEWINQQPRGDTVILAGDIGGTNANLALVNYNKEQPIDRAFSLLLKARFDSRAITSLIEPIRSVIQHAGDIYKPDLCCVSAAGPVSVNSCKPTNLSWVIDGDEISDTFRIPSVVINDFEALGYSLPVIDTSNPHLVEQLPHPGGKLTEPHGDTWAVTGAGTGLGVSSLARIDGRFIGRPSEGGHTDFSAFDSETRELKAFVAERNGCEPDAEMFLSGRGMAHILLFLRKTNRIKSDPLIDEICEKPVDEIPPYITKNTESSLGCKRVMKLFFRIYGRYAGNACLYLLPYAGLFLAGGIVARHTKTLFEDDTFMSAFESAPNAVMKSLLKEVPVYAIKDYATSLVGAANAAHSILSSKM